MTVYIFCGKGWIFFFFSSLTSNRLRTVCAMVPLGLGQYGLGKRSRQPYDSKAFRGPGHGVESDSRVVATADLLKVKVKRRSYSIPSRI